jgi:hypothetical protein
VVKIYDGQNVRTFDAPLFDRLEQKQQLERVSSKLAGLILEFCEQHTTFHMNELVAFVVARIPNTAPGSCDRILRQLRAEGRIAYEVTNRRASLYRVHYVSVMR